MELDENVEKLLSAIQFVIIQIIIKIILKYLLVIDFIQYPNPVYICIQKTIFFGGFQIKC